MKKYKINGEYLFLAIGYIIPFVYLTAIPMFWIDTDNLLIFLSWAWAWILVMATMITFFSYGIRRKDESKN